MRRKRRLFSALLILSMLLMPLLGISQTGHPAANPVQEAKADAKPKILSSTTVKKNNKTIRKEVTQVGNVRTTTTITEETIVVKKAPPAKTVMVVAPAKSAPPVASAKKVAKAKPVVKKRTLAKAIKRVRHKPRVHTVVRWRTKYVNTATTVAAPLTDKQMDDLATAVAAKLPTPQGDVSLSAADKATIRSIFAEEIAKFKNAANIVTPPPPDTSAQTFRFPWWFFAWPGLDNILTTLTLWSILTWIIVLSVIIWASIEALVKFRRWKEKRRRDAEELRITETEEVHEVTRDAEGNIEDESHFTSVSARKPVPGTT